MTDTIDSIMGTDENDKEKMTNQFTDVVNVLGSFRTQITAMQQQVRLLEKNYNKTIKQAEKEKNEKRRQKLNKKPSGFALPTKISDELCEFMDKENGTLVARTDVTRFIIGYIKLKELQNPVNRKFILPDAELKTLLNVSDEDELSYFNLQKYMNRHFHSSKSNDNLKEDDAVVDDDAEVNAS